MNNLFYEAYTSPIRGDGIDPAAGRNFYLGFRAEFGSLAEPPVRVMAYPAALDNS